MQNVHNEWYKGGGSMSDAQHLTDQERRVAEEIWLNYLNSYLLHQGAISHKEYARMTELIATRSRRNKPPPRKEVR